MVKYNLKTKQYSADTELMSVSYDDAEQRIFTVSRKTKNFGVIGEVGEGVAHGAGKAMDTKLVGLLAGLKGLKMGATAAGLPGAILGALLGSGLVRGVGKSLKNV